MSCFLSFYCVNSEISPLILPVDFIQFAPVDRDLPNCSFSIRIPLGSKVKSVEGILESPKSTSTFDNTIQLDFRFLPLKAFIVKENSVNHRIDQAESMSPNLVSNCI